MNSKRNYPLTISSRALVVLFAALAVTTLLYNVTASEQKAAHAVKIEDLNAPGGVIGELARPLGTVVTIEAEIVDGTKLFNPPPKALDGVQLLQVSSVKGQKLPKPCFLRFTANAKALKGHVKLIGYETGRFIGIPKDAFLYTEPIADVGFHFENSFVVLKSL